MLRLPNCGVRLRDVEFAKPDAVVGRDVELQVVARSEVNYSVHFQRFEDKLLDESRHAAIAGNTETERLGRACAGATGPGQVEEELAVAFLHWIRAETAADGRAGRRAVGQIEAPVVLGTFDDAALHKTVGEISVAVGADAVGDKAGVVGVAVKRVGLLAVIEADDILASQVHGVADFDPAGGVGGAFAVWIVFSTRAAGAGNRRFT